MDVTEPDDRLPAPPPEGGSPPTVTADRPGRPRVRGVPRRPWVVALLNLSGLGAGYVYLRRWGLWLAHVAVLVAIAVGGSLADASRQPAVWAGALGGWVLLSVVAGWWLARRAMRAAAARATEPPPDTAPARPDASPAVGSGRVAVAVSLLLMAGMILGGWAFASVGAAAFEDGTEAARRGDCRTAQERFRTVTTFFELTFSTDVRRADEAIEECDEFLAADHFRERGRFHESVSAFLAFAERYPDGVVGSGVLDATARTNAEWAETLVAEGDYEEATERYRIIEERFGDTPTARRIRPDVAAAYLAWGDFFRGVDHFRGALENYGVVLREYSDTPSASDAQTAVDELFARAANGLEGETACSSVSILDSFVAYEFRVRQARRHLPTAVYNCGLRRFRAALWSDAVEQFERVEAEFPHSTLAPKARANGVRARVKLLTVGGGDELGQPGRFGTAPSGTAVVVIYNDSPVVHELLFAGPEARSVELERCPECELVPPAESGGFCQEEGPRVEVTLAPGTYDVVLTSTGTNPVAQTRPTGGSWTLSSGGRYFFCFELVAE